MSPLRTIAICLVVGALQAGAAMAQSVKTPGGPYGPPGGLPGASMPMPTMPSAPAPAITLPPAPSVPEIRSPAIVVPPPPPPPAAERPRDAGGPEACDCYRMVDGKRVFTGKEIQA